MLVSSSCLQMIHLVCLFQYELDQIKFCYLFRMSFNILTELPSRLSSTLPPSSILNKKGLVRYSQYDNQGISIQIHGLWQKAVSFPWPLTRVDKLAEHCKGCCVVLLDGLHDTLSSLSSLGPLGPHRQYLNRLGGRGLQYQTSIYWAYK